MACGDLPVVLGAAPARELHQLSFADVLDEEQGTGYQRAFDLRHAREFRDYITGSEATTIPLTFNLRGPRGDGWRLTEESGPLCSLLVRRPTGSRGAVLSRVDCQHRLGMMAESSIPLTFQCYLGLSATEEMSIFNTINTKAKGLSPSLLDFHSTKLTPNLDAVNPELYIAKKLHDDKRSVWRGRVKLGGVSTQGSKRRASLRGLQSATKLLLGRCPLGTVNLPIERKYEAVRSFWEAVSRTWSAAWERPRQHLLTKGVGLRALSLLAADAITAALAQHQQPTAVTFQSYLAPLSDVDWSSDGPFKAFGGHKGAAEVHRILQNRFFTPALEASGAQGVTSACV